MTTKTTPTAPWRSRIVGMEDVAPDQLLAHPLNWREHPGPQRDALRGSLAEVGWVQNVIVSKRTGHVVDGHARVEDALSRHESTYRPTRRRSSLRPSIPSARWRRRTRRSSKNCWQASPLTTRACWLCSVTWP